jgi:hypothetical protein
MWLAFFATPTYKKKTTTQNTKYTPLLPTYFQLKKKRNTKKQKLNQKEFKLKKIFLLYLNGNIFF